MEKPYRFQFKHGRRKDRGQNPLQVSSQLLGIKIHTAIQALMLKFAGSGRCKAFESTIIPFYIFFRPSFFALIIFQKSKFPTAWNFCFVKRGFSVILDPLSTCSLCDIICFCEYLANILWRIEIMFLAKAGLFSLWNCMKIGCEKALHF